MLSLSEFFRNKQAFTLKEIFACYDEWLASHPKYHFENDGTRLVYENGWVVDGGPGARGWRVGVKDRFCQGGILFFDPYCGTLGWAMRCATHEINPRSAGKDGGHLNDAQRREWVYVED